MSEELTLLLPCPNPHCTADTMPRRWSTGVDCMTQCNHGIQCECGVSVASMTKKGAIDLWNALPRALEWTNELPKVPGKYWNRDIRYPSEAGIIIVAPSRVEQLQRMSKPTEQWAGPIHEPREPK